MRIRYYLWFAFGWFTVLTFIGGIHALIFGPGRIGPVSNAILSGFIAGFVTIILAVQMAYISHFHRAWFQIPDTFFAPFAGGILACGLFIGLSYLHPVLGILAWFAPIVALWGGSIMVSSFGTSRSKERPNQSA